MEDQRVEQPVRSQPWPFLLVKWYNYIFAMFFLLYGGVNIILGVLDRDYSVVPPSLAFLILGIVLMTICVVDRDRKSWGWYGLVGLNGLVALWCLIGYAETLNLVFLLLSLSCLALLLMPQTKAEIF